MGTDIGAEPRPAWFGRFPSWLLGLVPLAVIAAGLVAFAALNAPGVPKRAGRRQRSSRSSGPSCAPV